MALYTAADAVREAAARMDSGGGSDSEYAFRRGFHQAYEEAIRHVRAGRTLAAMSAHGDAILAWREGRPGASIGFSPPPEIGEVDPPRAARGPRHR